MAIHTLLLNPELTSYILCLKKKKKPQLKLMIKRKEPPLATRKPPCWLGRLCPRVCWRERPRHAYLCALFVTGHAIRSFAFCSQREKHRPIIPAAQTVWRLRQCFKIYICIRNFFFQRSGSLNSKPPSPLLRSNACAWEVLGQNWSSLVLPLWRKG